MPDSICKVEGERREVAEKSQVQPACDASHVVNWPWSPDTSEKRPSSLGKFEGILYSFHQQEYIYSISYCFLCQGHAYLFLAIVRICETDNSWLLCENKNPLGIASIL
jgi:hypothetical protein